MQSSQSTNTTANEVNNITQLKPSNDKDGIKNTPIEIKPYMKKEIAALYGIEIRSFYNWMRSRNHLVGKKIGKYLTCHQVRIIIRELGPPGIMDEN